jgi:hypothetical protein
MIIHFYIMLSSSRNVLNILHMLVYSHKESMKWLLSHSFLIYGEEWEKNDSYDLRSCIFTSVLGIHDDLRCSFTFSILTVETKLRYYQMNFAILEHLCQGDNMNISKNCICTLKEELDQKLLFSFASYKTSLILCSLTLQ